MKNNADKSPFKGLPSRLPFYYGWMMVPLAIIAQTVTGVGQTYGLSVFNPSLQQTLEISLSALTGTYMAGTLLAALPQPYIGSLMDRFGIRRTMLGVVVLLGGACIFFSQVNSILTLLVGFFLLRLLGQGGLSLLAGNIPAMWFREKLGSATGIVSSGFSITMAVIPPIFLFLINRSGWRMAYTQLGFAVWMIMLPLVLLFLKNKPGDVGQQIDGRALQGGRLEEIGTFGKESFEVKKARHTAAYWITLVNMALWAMVITAIFFNLLPIFKSLGIPENVAAATYTTFAAASLLTQLLLGHLADRGQLQVLLFASMAFLAGGLAVLSVASSPWIAHSYAVLIGISTGLINLVGGTLLARYFGRKHLGTLRGGVLTAQVAASSLGPFITGVIFDQTGSYQISLGIFIGILIPATIISLRAVQPQRLSS